jgi:hypothetical protein
VQKFSRDQWALRYVPGVQKVYSACAVNHVVCDQTEMVSCRRQSATARNGSPRYSAAPLGLRTVSAAVTCAAGLLRCRTAPRAPPRMGTDGTSAVSQLRLTSSFYFRFNNLHLTVRRLNFVPLTSVIVKPTAHGACSRNWRQTAYGRTAGSSDCAAPWACIAARDADSRRRPTHVTACLWHRIC